eukprot:2411302-Lingulodinium_polyedra.AAC.1
MSVVLLAWFWAIRAAQGGAAERGRRQRARARVNCRGQRSPLAVDEVVQATLGVVASWGGA